MQFLAFCSHFVPGLKTLLNAMRLASYLVLSRIGLCGENEREALNSGEDRSPPTSRDSPLSPPRRTGSEASDASPSLGACSGQPGIRDGDSSPNAVTNESQESRVYPVHDDSSPWDDIQCG